MKVIAFNGSPHPEGVIAKGLKIMGDVLEKEGITVEIMQAGLTGQGCVACQGCRKLGRCVFNDDNVNYCRELASAADGIILGSPVYYGGIAGNFKSFLDRLFFPGPNLAFKAGALVVSLRRSGGIAAFQQLNNYFNLSQVILSPGIYWDVFHGNTPAECAEDEEGVQILETEARNMAWLMKTLEAGRREIPLPPPVDRKRTNFIR